MRSALVFDIENPTLFKSQILHWISQFSKVSYLNSNVDAKLTSQKFSYASYDLLIAVESIEEISLNAESAFSQLKKFYTAKMDWLFGYLGYDLKNEIEQLVSENEDKLAFPELHFFRPKYVFILVDKKLTVEFLKEFSTDSEVYLMLQQIEKIELKNNTMPPSNLEIQSKVSKEKYIQCVEKIKCNIQRGDIYEMNYCVEFFVENSSLHPAQIYAELNQISQTPFSCFYRNESNYLMCASPERFLKKEATKIISQPIKGTKKRGTTLEEDVKLRQELFQDPKERSENVMIVDLVRNDLSRTALRGSVKVEELFGVYAFKQVHQLISTVTSELKSEIHFVDAIKNAFPMGSMTGAPKVRAMQLIEEFETSKRGLYSGAVGYISPQGNFDFNVVIRSILHDSHSKISSFMVGSAITSNSIAEKEYEECLLKADAMFQVLNKN